MPDGVWDQGEHRFGRLDEQVLAKRKQRSFAEGELHKAIGFAFLAGLANHAAFARRLVVEAFRFTTAHSLLRERRLHLHVGMGRRCLRNSRERLRYPVDGKREAQQQQEEQTKGVFHGIESRERSVT